MNSDWQKLQDWIFRTSAYEMAINMIEIDRSTVAPKAGAAYRDERRAYLSGELFSMETSPEIQEVLKNLQSDETLNGTQKRIVTLYAQEMKKMTCVPKDFFLQYTKLQNASYDAWYKAKMENNYAIFAPYLKEMVEQKKQLYAFRGSDKPVYEQMLEDYEPGTDTDFYDSFFDQIKAVLIPLIAAITQAEPIDDSFLFQNYPVDGQKKFMEHLLDYLGFDASWGYQNETEHPFTAWICENDCRTTTKYLPNAVASAVFSTIHECGHAWYEHNIDPEYDGMILSNGVSSGMHESESRLCENYLGRTKAFWETNYPVLQETFPEQLGAVSLDAFVKAVNAAKPSLVRTEADELTYPMHISIRYEIEKKLFMEDLPTDHLDEVWNELYQECLGVHAEKASEGILQDVHWANGDFGYFPTYALGSAYAAQFMHTMRSEIDVDELLRTNQYRQTQAWLKEHVQKYGCRYAAREILKMATGEDFNAKYYIEYLTEKYETLYGLKQ